MHEDVHWKMYKVYTLMILCAEIRVIVRVSNPNLKTVRDRDLRFFALASSWKSTAPKGQIFQFREDQSTGSCIFCTFSISRVRVRVRVGVSNPNLKTVRDRDLRFFALVFSWKSTALKGKFSNFVRIKARDHAFFVLLACLGLGLLTLTWKR